MSGDDASEIFATAIDGVHRSSTLGLVDVSAENCAWSVKTVKANHPFEAKRLRLISGRNSPDYSLGMAVTREDLQKTGDAVLSIWNARIDEVLAEFDELREVVLVRNFPQKQFALFEVELQRFVPDEFTWRYNDHKNIEGFEKTSGDRRFTWQFSGGQFTVHQIVPSSTRKFSIKKEIPKVSSAEILKQIGYSPDWIEQI